MDALGLRPLVDRMDKSELRRQVLADFATIPPDDRRRMSEALARNLLGLPQLREPRAILAFLAMDDELDTDPLIRRALEAGHRIYSPRTLRKARRLVPIRLLSLDDVVTGAYGIREPAGDEAIEPQDLDVVVVPAVAFDQRGWRLGRGGGYYDRFLELVAPQALICGVAFSRYVLDQVPTEPHDKPVHLIVTEDRVIRPQPRSA